jgi:hypothetical protein
MTTENLRSYLAGVLVGTFIGGAVLGGIIVRCFN